MVQRRGHAIQELSRVVECRHHWMIESADGPTSRGVCKYCGADKDFLNYMPEHVGKHGRNSECLEPSC